MNTDKLSLFSIATGPRGSDKTLYATSVACERLVKSFCAQTWPDKVPSYLGGPVYSNYPVGFKFYLGNRRTVYLETLPLNMEAMITFDEELRHSWVFIDEIDIWADRQDWQSVTSRLLAKVFQQIRKKKMSLFATIQDLNWLNKRLQFQADIIIKCREAAFTPWGRANGLEMGEIGFLNFMDKSGVLTGYTFDETGKIFQRVFKGKKYWNCYNTEYEFDVLASSVQYKLKKTVKEIDLTGNGDGEYPEMKSERKEHDMVLLADLAAELTERNHGEITKPDFRRMAMDRGLKSTTMYSIEKYLSQIGVKVSGREFSFVQK